MAKNIKTSQRKKVKPPPIRRRGKIGLAIINKKSPVISYDIRLGPFKNAFVLDVFFLEWRV